MNARPLLHQTWRVVAGDCRKTLGDIEVGSIRACVTSPPYFGLRDYGHEDQIGLEPTPEEFAAAMVTVFREVRRVLADDGTIWLNLGDSYAGGGSGARDPERWPKQSRNDHMPAHAKTKTGAKNKDLLGIPWMVAFALRADGWYLRQEIIWHKRSPMPESVRDRCTRSHEHLFMLAKRPRYFYDAEAIAEDAVSDHPSGNGYARDERTTYQNADGTARGQEEGWTNIGGKRNRRDVWTLTAEPFAGAHFATFPTKLVEPCILAGSEPGDTILDPFAGACTTGLVALRLNRSFIGLELSDEYAALGRDRIIADSPLLNTHAEVAA